MKDPKFRPAACEKCDKEDCPLYLIDELNGQEVCMEYEVVDWKDEEK